MAPSGRPTALLDAIKSVAGFRGRSVMILTTPLPLRHPTPLSPLARHAVRHCMGRRRAALPSRVAAALWTPAFAGVTRWKRCRPHRPSPAPMYGSRNHFCKTEVSAMLTKWPCQTSNARSRQKRAAGGARFAPLSPQSEGGLGKLIFSRASPAQLLEKARFGRENPRKSKLFQPRFGAFSAEELAVSRQSKSPHFRHEGESSQAGASTIAETSLP